MTHVITAEDHKEIHREAERLINKAEKLGCEMVVMWSWEGDSYDIGWTEDLAPERVLVLAQHGARAMKEDT